ncbi:MAG: hypothetical protein AMXMBFR37_06900 [Steroidobacteraceae bacterium]
MALVAVPLSTWSAVPAVKWTEIKKDVVSSINSTLIPGRPTADVGIYIPSNLDPAFNASYSLDETLEEFRRAQQIFAEAGVQLRLAWVKTGEIDPRFLEIQANDMSGETPGGRRVNMYVDTLRQQSSLSPEAREAFGSIIEKVPNGDRMVHLVVLQDVFMSFFEKIDERTYEERTITTGGLSFPSYSYLDIPRHARGVITITRNDDGQRLIAHELGHKLLNVSHEYRSTNPQHEVRADGGLMLYGKGTEIASGADGRWHKERLLLSPYVYRENAKGVRTYNPDYREGGHYYDPIYGEYVVRFGPETVTGPAPP